MKAVRKAAPLHIAPFDVADYLDDEAMIAAYLDEVVATGDARLFLKALGDVARARGMSKLADESGLGRESLYKSLRPGAKPRYDTVQTVMAAMGMRLAVMPLEPSTPKRSGRKPAHKSRLTASRVPA